MATVLRIEGFVVRIWSHDHLPCHVHIFKGNGECVINLIGANGNPELREFYGMKRQELAKAIQIVYDYQENRIIINFENRNIFSFTTNSVSIISNLAPKVLATVELTPSGKGLRWDEPDIDLSIIGLMMGISDKISRD